MHSKEEVDDMQKTVSTEENTLIQEEKHTVLIDNFCRPVRLLEEQLSFLKKLHRDFCHRKLSSLLSLPLSVQLDSEDEFKYEEFARSTLSSSTFGEVELEPSQIEKLFKDEYPQTIAMILSYLKPEISAAILSQLSEPNKSRVLKRIDSMEKVDQKTIAKVEQELERKFLKMKSS